MTAEAIIERCRDLVTQPLGAVAEQWKSQHPGGKVVAVYPVWAPAEVIHAAGMLPLSLLGGGTSVELTHADARFQSFVCSIAKSTLELGFQGLVKGVDGFVYSNICDVARNLSSIYQRNFQDVFVEYLHLPQNSTSASVAVYCASELRRLAAAAEKALGLGVTPMALGKSIDVYNALRARLRAFYAFRIAEPQKLSTVDLYVVLRAATLVPPEEAIPSLDTLLAELPRRSARPRDRLRVVIEGAFCEQPPIGLLEVLEDAGCYVVEDDLLLGWRWITGDVAGEGDPYDRLGAAYVNQAVPSSTRHEGREHRSVGLIEKVRRANAQAVIFMPAKFCEPALFDYVLMRQGLELAGIPHMLVEFEEKMWTFERTRNEIETFVESMMFD
ncbi:MAG: 2-hydroxyacyl-CoA dehydratase [Candidatus Rokubacteria bacterium]|nr:2-hydroxyacyl-CoA dehydratase [Candidatus Rokubacteria bacterium]MBI3105682.1 2-hydroxyacyl-CoA dehydratase [Candidatus Rokubacteria bacterium]